MKYPFRLTLSIGLLFFCACSLFKAKQPSPPTPQVIPMKALVAPVGKNWQVEIAAPAMTNVRTNQLPFQTEQSVEPDEDHVVLPADQRKIDTPR
jgi:hypothetical protein